jgi:predicted TIM-barrel fold metal-dependent hydrolase
MANRKIVDAHHHLWNLGRGYNYPWLQDKLSGDGMLGNLATIARDYLLPEYRVDTSNYDVVGSVHIEAVPADPGIETRWLQETTKSKGLPSAIVASVELQKPDAEKALAEQVTFQNVRGIRQNLNWRQNPRYTFTEHDFLIDDAWHAAFSLLRRYKLSFDLQLYQTQMADAVELARRNPETLIVVNHPACRSSATRRASTFGATASSVLGPSRTSSPRSPVSAWPTGVGARRASGRSCSASSTDQINPGNLIWSYGAWLGFARSGGAPLTRPLLARLRADASPAPAQLPDQATRRRRGRPRW